MVRQAPLGHDRATTADDTGDALGGQRHIAQQHTGVDGEVVHALLGLLDQGVAEQFPGQVFGHAVDLFQGLVDRHGTNRHRRVADDPLTGFVNVLAGGQVHDRVRTPADAPGQLGHFFLDRGTQGAVADVAVDLHQEVAADDHRLHFRVVDVGRDDRAATGNFLANELGGDFLRDVGPEAVAGVLLVEQAGGACLLQLHVFADGHILHLGSDDALAGIVHLRDVGARLGTARVAHVGETQLGQFGIVQALLAEVGAQAGQALGVTACLDPRRTHVGQALAHVDDNVGVGVRAGSIVDQHRGIGLATKIGRGVVQADFTHGHADVRARAFDIHLARTRERLHGLLIDLCRFAEVDRFFLFGHHRLSRRLPSSGMSG
ncbi:hypothetical protein D3C72_713560 [compost metagenome]